MPLLQVREFPETTYALLSKAAEAENRSITQQTIYLLTHALQDENCRNKLRRSNVLNEINGLNFNVSENTPSYTSMVREDRERDEGVLS